MGDIIASPLTRHDLQGALGNNLKVIQAFEKLFRTLADTSNAVTAGAEATQALNDATVITLSANETLTNERVLAVDSGSMTIALTADNVVLSARVTVTGIFRCTLSLIADTNVSLPTGGRIPSSDDGPYADDTAAAAAGVEVGEWYAKTGGTVVWRQV